MKKQQSSKKLAQKDLNRIMPLDEFIRKRKPDAAGIELYHHIKNELQDIAKNGSVTKLVSVRITAKN